MDNLARFEVTGHYRWWTAIGVRASFADRGLTFGTNTAAGVCVCFHERVDATGPLLGSAASALTVTVADVGGLATTLAGYGVPGDTDSRR